MPVKKKKIVVYSAVALPVLLILTLLATLLIGPEINLNGFVHRLEKAAGAALGRQVEVAGPVHLTISFWPSLEVNGLTIKNPEDFHYPVLAKAGRLKCQIGLWHLLFGEIRVYHLMTKDVVVCLAPERKDEESSPDKTKAANGGSGFRLKQIDAVDLQNCSLRYFDSGLKRQYVLNLEEVRGKAGRGEDIQLLLKGKLDNYDFLLKTEADALGSFQGKGRWKTNIRGNWGKAQINAGGDLTHGDDGLTSESRLNITNVDVGEIVSWLGLVEGVTAGAQQVDLTMKWSGQKLLDIVRSLEITASLTGGYWILRDHNTKAQAQLKISRGLWEVTSGNRSKLSLDGAIDDIPANIVITGPVPGENIDGKKPVELDLKASMADTEVEMKSKTVLPLESGHLSLGFGMRGQSMGSLSELLRVKLPEWGPYEFKGNLVINNKGYNFEEIYLLVGQSDLKGNMVLNTTANVPSLLVNLKTSLLQLNDFIPPKSQAEKTTLANDPKKQKTAVKIDDQGRVDGQPLQRILSKYVLDSFNAKLTVDVGMVRSGKDDLGSGKLDLIVSDGKLSLKTLDLHILGGLVRLGGLLKPDKDNAKLHLWAKIENFDYGVLARRDDPDSKAKGRLSLDAEINADDRQNQHLLANANGHLGLWIKPEDMGAGIMDLWAANVLFAVFQNLANKQQSKVNCLLAQLILKDGILRQDSLVIDTTKMRVKGEAEVDFKNQTVYMHLAPEAKKAQFFSLETPIEIRGSFDDFKAGLAPGGFLGTAVYFITSPVHVPLRRLFSSDLSEDGCDICCHGLKKAGEKSEK